MCSLDWDIDAHKPTDMGEVTKQKQVIPLSSPQKTNNTIMLCCYGIQLRTCLWTFCHAGYLVLSQVKAHPFCFSTKTLCKPFYLWWTVVFVKIHQFMIIQCKEEEVAARPLCTLHTHLFCPLGLMSELKWFYTVCRLLTPKRFPHGQFFRKVYRHNTMSANKA